MAIVNKIALLVLVCVTTSFACMYSGGETGGDNSRASCDNGVKCPEYTVEEVAQGYERRMYAPRMWVGTNVVGNDYEQAGSEGFRKLFKYISGENEQGKKIAMTSPVIQMADEKRPSEVMTGSMMTYTIYFYLSSEYQAEGAPMPTNPDVFIQSIPSSELYAREFSGYASTEMYMEEAMALSSLLQEAGEPFECDMFATAGYDGPYKPFNRRNEVWFPKTRDGTPAARCREGNQ